MITYPLNNVLYGAEDAELFHCTRSSGVYAGDDFDISVSGANNTVVLQEGIAWIRNSRFSGKVAALKSTLSLDLGISDASYPRIDAIVIQFDANKNSTDLIVKNGTPGSSPIAPPVVQTESLYELHLYHVLRPAASAAVISSNVTDLRNNEAYCGIMYDGVTKVSDAVEKLVEGSVNEKLPKALNEAKESGEFDGAPGRGIVSMTYSASTNKWTIAWTDNTTSAVDGPAIPDVSGYMLRTGDAFTGVAYAMSGAGATPQLRNTALYATDTDPTVKGQINWTYE